MNIIHRISLARSPQPSDCTRTLSVVLVLSQWKCYAYGNELQASIKTLVEYKADLNYRQHRGRVLTVTMPEKQQRFQAGYSTVKIWAFLYVARGLSFDVLCIIFISAAADGSMLVPTGKPWEWQRGFTGNVRDNITPRSDLDPVVEIHWIKANALVRRSSLRDTLFIHSSWNSISFLYLFPNW